MTTARENLRRAEVLLVDFSVVSFEALDAVEQLAAAEGAVAVAGVAAEFDEGAFGVGVGGVVVGGDLDYDGAVGEVGGGAVAFERFLWFGGGSAVVGAVYC